MLRGEEKRPTETGRGIDGAEWLSERGWPRPAKMLDMGFSPEVQSRLLSASGGNCANPACRNNLFAEHDGKFAKIADMAHIIASSPRGPRGNGDIPETERDTYENAVLLCPNCHRLIDNRKLEGAYDTEELRRWKHDREREVNEATGTPEYATRDELVAEIQRLLRENKAIWETVGPGGPEGQKVMSGTVGQWKRQRLGTIIPNNWRILALARKNEDHLTSEELGALAEFRVHADAFAYNAVADQPVEGQPQFPISMSRAFE